MASKKENKLDILKKRLKKTTRPAKIMDVIISVFGDSSSIPIPGQYCTFVYDAKTPKLVYDRHPLIAVMDLEEWGFRGFNFHLNSHRNYNWGEVTSIFCPIEGGEISYFRNLKYTSLSKNR